VRSFCILIVLGSLVSMTGCRRDAIPTELSKICSPANEKKYVSTSGFLDDKGGVFCSNTGGRMDCGFAVAAAAGADKVFSADIEEGGGASEVEKLPSGYKKEDIKIRDNSGSVIKLSEKVTLTGEMSIAPDGSVCFMKVDRIEKQ
jgi:hypothetical protein